LMASFQEKKLFSRTLFYKITRAWNEKKIARSNNFKPFHHNTGKTIITNMFEHHVFCTRISKHVYVRYLLLTKYDVRTRRQGVANARSEVAEAVKYTHDGIKTLFCNNKEGGKRENYDDQLFWGSTFFRDGREHPSNSIAGPCYTTVTFVNGRKYSATSQRVAYVEAADSAFSVRAGQCTVIFNNVKGLISDCAARV